jgi:ABC-type branched-subunit amino acid transport system permease subunit
MRTSLKRGLRVGFVTGFIYIFLMVIGFIAVGATMIGNLLGTLSDAGADTRLPVVNLLVLICVFGFVTGSNIVEKKKDSTWLETLIGSVSSGLIGGVFIAGVVWGIGSLHMQGIDFRTYLPKLGPDEMPYLLFYSTPFAAARAYLMYFVISNLIGSVMIKSLSTGNWLSKLVEKTKHWIKKLSSRSEIKNFFNNKLTIIVLLVLVGVALYFLPLVWGSYWNYIMGTVAIYILLGLGLNIAVGFSGQLVLGYAAFFAIGAYTFALLTAPEPHGIEMNVWLAIIFSIATATLAGLLLGLPILNLRGDYLAIVTLGFGEIIRILIKSDLMSPFTNGPNGITNVGQPSWLGKVFSDVNYVHLLMLLVLVGLFVAKRLKDSRTGRAWIAIREDQTVAQATGVNTYRYKILALLLGAAFAGLAGALFASRNQFAGPEDFTLMVSINALCIVIVGGMGSLPGIIVGGFVLKGIPELLRELEDYRLLVFGALLVVMMILRPSGLWPAKKKGSSYSVSKVIIQDKGETEA